MTELEKMFQSLSGDVDGTPDEINQTIAHQNAVQLTLETTVEANPEMRGQLRTVDAALSFIKAGNAYFTIRSLRTGTRFTYRVTRAECKRCGQKDCHCWANPMLFVSVLTGPDNWENYKYSGYIKDNLFQSSAKKGISQSAPSTIAFDWLWRALTTPNRPELPKQLELWHEGRCGRCGRKLTVPESIERGIGPDCAGKM